MAEEEVSIQPTPGEKEPPLHGKGRLAGPSFWSTLDGPGVPWNSAVSPKTQGAITTPILQTGKQKPVAQIATTHQEAAGGALVSASGCQTLEGGFNVPS